jgi:hypothetical protein
MAPLPGTYTPCNYYGKHFKFTKAVCLPTSRWRTGRLFRCSKRMEAMVKFIKTSFSEWKSDEQESGRHRSVRTDISFMILHYLPTDRQTNPGSPKVIPLQTWLPSLPALFTRPSGKTRPAPWNARVLSEHKSLCLGRICLLNKAYCAF